MQGFIGIILSKHPILVSLVLQALHRPGVFLLLVSLDELLDKLEGFSFI